MTDYLDRAENASKSYDRALTDIRRNDTLSDNGKKRRIAELWLGHTKSMNALRDEYKAHRQERRGSLEKSLFGGSGFLTAADTLAYRQAMLHAMSVESEDEAATLIRNSIRVGDRIFARQLAHRAAELDEYGSVRWTKALEAYTGDDPNLRSDIEEYVAVSKPGSVFNDPTAMALATGVNAATPIELEGISDVEQFVASE